jgi:multicomponent Na+:H+ antiporter subunit G
MTLESIRFVIAALLMAGGIFTLFVSILGVFRFKFVLNRMHSASIADTLGLLMVMLSLIVVYGFDFASLKLLAMIVFMWLASPISSHLISKLEATTDPALSKHLKTEVMCEEERTEQI